MRKSLMPRWWRLLVALAIIAFISITLYPPGGDANFSGIFDNAAASINDLDDDLDEMPHRLRPERAANAAVPDFDAAALHLLRLSPGFAGRGLASWAGRPPADRGPPTGHTRQQLDPTLIATLPPAPSVVSITFSAARTPLLAVLDSTARGAHTPVPYGPPPS